MENTTATKLLKAKALGCLDHIEDSELLDYMQTAENFPWAELGEFQNLVSLLPLYLPIELPGIEVKESFKSKLVELHAQLHPVQEENPAVEDDQLQLPEEEIVIDDVDYDSGNGLNQDFKEEVFVEETIEKDEDLKDDKYSESLSRVKSELFDDYKEQTNKKINESLKRLDNEIYKLDQTMKRNFFISIGLILVMIVVLIFIYMSLSSRIDDQQDKYDRLKNEIGIIHDDLQNTARTLNIT